MNNTPPPVPDNTTLAAPRLGFVAIFAISAFFQIALAGMAINDGYFPSEEIRARIPQSDWYWTANRILMPSFLITGIVSLFSIFRLLTHKYTRDLYFSGIIASIMTVLPIGIFCLIPLIKWVRRRHHFNPEA